jgi:hypothetical protein
MKGRRPDGWSRIGNFHISCTRVWTKAEWRPDGDIWIAILALFMTASVRCINLPIFWTWKESEADRSLMDVRTNASWNRSFSIQWMVRTDRHVVWTDDAGLSYVRTVDQWTDGCPDGITRRLDGWQGIWNLLSSVQSLLKMLWQVESLFTAPLHISDFVQTQNEAKILTDLSFIETWKESETGRVPRGVRTCCWNVRTDTSWIKTSQHSGGSGRKCTSFGRMMFGLTGVRTVWHVVRTDGTVVKCASGRDGSIVRTTDRETKSSIFHTVQSLLRVLWIVESLFTTSLHTQVILSIMRPKY